MNYPFNLFDLHGKVALITGGSGGLGKVFARSLAGAGADIAMLGRRVDAAEAEAEPIRAEMGRRVITVQADVRESDQVTAAVERVVEALGSVDILINSAGVNVRRPALEFPLDDWTRVLEINLTGAFICSRAVVPHMVTAGWGRVINVSSMLGMVGLGERAAYTAAKGGLIQLTRTLALEWAPHNITVNALAPGPFETEMNRPLIENPQAYRAFADKIPLNRWGKTDELAGAVLYMASPASDFMTGTVLTVDGGWTAQ